MGGATGMATMAMAIALLGMLLPYTALAIAIFALCLTAYTNFNIWSDHVYVVTLNNVFRKLL